MVTPILMNPLAPVDPNDRLKLKLTFGAGTDMEPDRSRLDTPPFDDITLALGVRGESAPFNLIVLEKLRATLGLRLFWRHGFESVLPGKKQVTKVPAPETSAEDEDKEESPNPCEAETLTPEQLEECDDTTLLGSNDGKPQAGSPTVDIVTKTGDKKVWTSNWGLQLEPAFSGPIGENWLWRAGFQWVPVTFGNDGKFISSSGIPDFENMDDTRFFAGACYVAGELNYCADLSYGNRLYQGSQERFGPARGDETPVVGLTAFIEFDPSYTDVSKPTPAEEAPATPPVPAADPNKGKIAQLNQAIEKIKISITELKVDELIAGMKKAQTENTPLSLTDMVAKGSALQTIKGELDKITKSEVDGLNDATLSTNYAGVVQSYTEAQKKYDENIVPVLKQVAAVQDYIITEGSKVGEAMKLYFTQIQAATDKPKAKNLYKERAKLRGELEAKLDGLKADADLKGKWEALRLGETFDAHVDKVKARVLGDWDKGIEEIKKKYKLDKKAVGKKPVKPTSYTPDGP